MSICKDIIEEIKKEEMKIKNFFIITPEEFSDKLEKKIQINDNELNEFKEKYLTFIIACAYAYHGKQDCYLLQQILCENSLPIYSEEGDYRIYFEARPLNGKSSPKLDLAFGSINRTVGSNTKAQIEYNPQKGGGQICFIEMKTLDDMDSSSKGNPIYNQLAKYIRAGLIFQKAGIFPNEVNVTLVTPRIFIKKFKSRFYGYKYIEYACPQINPENIMPDIPIGADGPPYIENEELNDNWIKCDKDGLIERFPSLRLHWIPYENLLYNIPDINPLKKYIDKIREANPIFDKPPESK